MKIKLFFILFVISLFDSFVFSQCSMCKVVAESAGADFVGSDEYIDKVKKENEEKITAMIEESNL